VNEVRVLLEAGDYVAAQRLHTRWTPRQIAAHAGALVAGVALASIASRVAWLLVPGCALVGGAAGSAIAREFSRRFVLPRRARRIFAQQKNLQCPFEFRWDDDALLGVNERGSNRTPWSDYVKWAQDDRIILLYLSDAMFQMVPKRCFGQPAQLEAFLARAVRIGSP
jgi:hypothetical protein